MAVSFPSACPCFPLLPCVRVGTSPDTNKTLEAMLSDEALDEVAGWAAGVGLDKSMLIKWERQGGMGEIAAGAGNTAEERRTSSEPESLGGSAAAVQLRVEPGPCNASKATGGYASSGLLERLHARYLQVRGISAFTPNQVLGELGTEHGWDYVALILKPSCVSNTSYLFLKVHPYTFRNEARFVTEHLDGDAQREYAIFFGPPSGAQQQVPQSHSENVTQQSAVNTVPSAGFLGRVSHRKVLQQNNQSENGNKGDACLSPFQTGGGVDGIFTEFVTSAAGLLKLNQSAQWDLPAVNRGPKLAGNCSQHDAVNKRVLL